MTFTTKTYEQDFIHAQICSFEGKGGVTEYHIMFSVTDPSTFFRGTVGFFTKSIRRSD